VRLSGQAKRVLVYTAALLLAPIPVMPFERGTREYALAIMVWGAIMSLSSFYVVRGQLRVKQRSLLGNKLLAASIITLLWGMAVFVGSIVYLGLKMER
jgi:hypothetical protein